MNQTLIDGFLKWWTSRSSDIADQIFHSDASYVDCIGQGQVPMHGGCDAPEEGSVGLFSMRFVRHGEEATLVFEEADEITGLLYRQAIYLRSANGKIAEVIHIKESVATPNTINVQKFR